MRLEHHLVGGYVRYISPHIIIILLKGSIWLNDFWLAPPCPNNDIDKNRPQM